MNDQTATIAVLRGAPNSDVQALLRKLVERWRGTARLAGVVGEGHGIPDRECGAGYLRSLATGERFPIFTDRGSPTGCHLDGRGAIDAATVSAWLETIGAHPAWARRSVQLWVFLPPLILMMLEQVALGTHHVLNILEYRLGSVFTHGLAAPGPDGAADPHLTLNLLFVNVDPLPAFANVDMWLGVGVAALLIVATIRIRQYRDDT